GSWGENRARVDPPTRSGASERQETPPMDAPPILVTGASGFLGEHLCRRLAAAGQVVVGVVHRNRVDVPGVEMRAVDLADGAAVDALVAGVAPAGIVHAAAMTHTATCEQQPAAARGA